MATKQESSGVKRPEYYTNEDDSEEDSEDKEGAHVSRADPKSVKATCQGSRLGSVLKPISKWVKEWNRVFLMVCATGLFVDPLYLYTLSVSKTSLCVYVDGWLAITITAIRSMTDLLHLWHMWLLLKKSKPEPYGAGIGTRGDIPKNKALEFIKSKKGLLVDLFVILPLPQVVLWVVVPYLLEKDLITWTMNAMLLTLAFQYIPRIYIAGRHFRFMNRNNGSIWLGFAISLIALFVASHAEGASWYLLGLQRSTECMIKQCGKTKGCDLSMLSYKEPVYHGTKLTANMVRDRLQMAWTKNNKARSTCLDFKTTYNYGSYQWTLQAITHEIRLEKILLSFFWAIMTIITLGNLVNSDDWTEIFFYMIMITTGILLLALLIGNTKVFVSASTSKKKDLQMKVRDIEWWMDNRRLPQGFKRRVRNYERQKWAAMRGVDEHEMILDLPEVLRRDIKYHLCLDLVRQVPLFQHMDELVLENICDRLKSHIYTKGEIIQQEGDPVERMLFVVRGHLQSSQMIRDGVKSDCMLGPGNFSGDELLSWCLRRPFVEKLPFSATTLTTLDTMEAFGLEAEDIKYVTQHFRYTFVSEKVRRSARYYSTGWRTWAAVIIQLAWRRYMERFKLKPLLSTRPRRYYSSFTENNIKLYTAMLTSPKPNLDHFH